MISGTKLDKVYIDICDNGDSEVDGNRKKVKKKERNLGKGKENWE